MSEVFDKKDALVVLGHNLQEVGILAIMREGGEVSNKATDIVDDMKRRLTELAGKLDGEITFGHGVNEDTFTQVLGLLPTERPVTLEAVSEFLDGYTKLQQTFTPDEE